MAPSRYRPAANERRSWRDRSSAARKTRTTFRPLRWLFTIVLLILVAVFAWVLWPRYRQARHLVAIAIWATDQLSVEPPPYAGEDIEALSQIRDVQFHGSLGLQDAASFAGLGPQLRKLVQPDDDLLLVYLAAHGISDGDQAYLVCSDFLRDAAAGRYPLRDLLRDLVACPTKCRLLVLDSGRIAYDPRLGVVANEFPRLLERELKQLEKQELWVLVSNSPLERSVVAHPWRHTVFGRSVAAALAGVADQPDPDGYVTLEELYRQVWQDCRGWFGADLAIGPRPLLMQAGRGIVQPTPGREGDARHRLVWVPPPEPADGETQEAPPPKPSPAGVDEAKKSQATRSGVQPAWAVAGMSAAWLQAGPPAADSPAAPPADAAPSADAAKPQPSSDPAARPADAPPASPAAPADVPPAGPTKSKPSGPKPDEPPPTKPAAGDTQPPAEAFAAELQRLRESLHQAWTLRDELQQQSWPIRLAPHLWRELNAELLHCEQHCRSGRPVEAGPQDADTPVEGLATSLAAIQRLVKDLTGLGSMSPGAEPSSSVARQLAKIRRGSAVAKPAPAPGPRPGEPAEVGQVREAAEAFQLLLFTAPYYVRWCALSGFSSTMPPPLQAELCGYLDGLQRFAQSLKQLQSRTLDARDTTTLAGILRDYRALVAQRNQLDQRIELFEQAALEGRDEPLHQQQIEDLLATPLLAADRRRRLLEALLETSVSLPSARPSADLARTPGEATDAQWQRVVERLELELRLIRLADPAAAANLQSGVAELAALAGQPPLNAESLWGKCRELGSQLRDFYRVLPSARDYDKLRLVDPRDASLVGESVPTDTFRLDVRVPAILRLTVPDQQRLEQQAPQPLTIQMTASKAELLEQIPSLTLDPQLLALSAGPDQGPIRSEAGWFHRELTWQIAARADQETAGVSESQIEIKVTWSDGEQARQETRMVSVTLPQPNRIDIQLIRVGSTVAHPDAAATVDLDLYPNRRTRYQLSLVNRSGQERKVDVALYAIEAEAAAGLAPGRIDAATRRRVVDPATGILSAKLIAKTPAPLPLPMDAGQSVPVSCAPPAPATPAAKPAEGQAPPPTASGSIAADVSAGLVCVITDAKNPDQRWTKWLEWTIVAPRRYLGAEAGYDYDKRGIVVRLRGEDFDGDGQTDLPEGPSAAVRWFDHEGEIPQDAKRQLEGQLERSAGQLELFAGVVPDDRARTVSLTVDGYPRAFVFRVPCDRQAPPSGFAPGSDLRRTDRQVRINRVVVPDYARVFHFAPYALFPPPQPKPEGDQAPPPVQVKVPEGETISLPAPCRALQVDFEVDGPVAAFRDPDHRVELMLGDRLLPPLVRYSDRSQSARIVGLGERGLIEFETAVADFSLNLSPGALENEKTYLQADLLLPGIGDARDTVLLILDADQPTIDQVEVFDADRNQPIPLTRDAVDLPQGKPLALRIHARDLSGVAQVEYEVSAEPGEQIDPAAARKMPPENIRRVDRSLVCDVPLDLKEFPAARGWLRLRLDDPVGHASRIKTIEFRLREPPKPAVAGVIAGAIRFEGNAAVNGLAFNATIEGPAIGTRKLDLAGDGSFRMPNLPPGKYTIRAAGAFLGREAVGVLPDIEPSPPNQVQRVTVVVRRRPQD